MITLTLFIAALLIVGFNFRSKLDNYENTAEAMKTHKEPQHLKTVTFKDTWPKYKEKLAEYFTTEFNNVEVTDMSFGYSGITHLHTLEPLYAINVQLKLTSGSSVDAIDLKKGILTWVRLGSSNYISNFRFIIDAPMLEGNEFANNALIVNGVYCFDTILYVNTLVAEKQRQLELEQKENHFRELVSKYSVY
jgi:cupin superfamily acireductone dioxygenase involved in methionine salvage